MRQFILLLLPMLAFIATSAATIPAHAAAGGIQDNASLFSSSAIDNANGVIHQIRTGDHRDVFVVTYPAVPEDRQAELTSKGKQRFFAEWAEDLGRERGVSGVVILLIKNPGHLEIAVGNKTREGIFTVPEDRNELEQRMLKHLREKTDTRYDDALLEGLKFIKTTMDRHPARGAPGVTPANPFSPTNTPTPNYPSPTTVHQSAIGGWICLGVGILIAVFLIMGIANRNRNYGNYGGGYSAPPTGGYPPGYSGPYPQGGGFFGGGGGGGGFGRGLLGGLLGGALGAWGYEKFNQGSQSPNSFPPQPNNPAGGYPDNTPDQTDTSFSSTGADFDSSSNSGSTDSSSSSDFGGTDDSGGSNFGGGGDSGGGDSGGGGGDSGGGDSGGGGDF